MLGQFDEKVVAGVPIEIVAVLLIAVLAKLASDHRCGNMSAERIMPPKAVLNNGYQSVSHISHQDMAARQLCRVQRLERVRDIETIQWLRRVVEQRREVGAGIKSGETDKAAARNAHRPHGATRKDLRIQGRGKKLAHRISELL